MSQKGVIVVSPSVRTDVRLDKEQYRRSDNVTVNLSISNLKSVPTGEVAYVVRVLDPKNAELWSQNFTLSLNASEAVNKSFVFQLSPDPEAGIYIVSAESTVVAEGKSYSSYAYFSVPEEYLLLSKLSRPNALTLGSPASFGFELANTRSLDVENATIVFKAAQSTGKVLANYSANFDLPANASKWLYFNFTPSGLEPMAQGFVDVSYEVYSRSGKRFNYDRHRYPHRILVEPLLDRLEVKTGENASVKVKLANKGNISGVNVFANATTDFGSSVAQSAALNAGDELVLSLSAQVPKTIKGTLHAASIRVSGDGIKEQAFDSPLIILYPSITHSAVLDKQVVNGGEILQLRIELNNTGGFELNNLSIRITIPSVAESNATADVAVNEVKTAVLSLSIPAAVIQGNYNAIYEISKNLSEFGINGTLLESGRAQVQILGYSAQIKVFTDKSTYEPGSVLTLLMLVNNTGSLALSGEASINVYRLGIDDGYTKQVVANLTAKLIQQQSSNGSWEGDVIKTSQAISALSLQGYAQSSSAQSAVSWLLAKQRSDGSWEGSVISTSWAINALLDAGYGISNPVVQKGVAWLMAQQRVDGSWGEAL